MLFTEFVSEPSGLSECDGYPWGEGICSSHYCLQARGLLRVGSERSVSFKYSAHLSVLLPQGQTLLSVKSCGGTMAYTTALWKHQEIPQGIRTKKLS